MDYENLIEALALFSESQDLDRHQNTESLSNCLINGHIDSQALKDEYMLAMSDDPEIWKEIVDHADLFIVFDQMDPLLIKLYVRYLVEDFLFQTSWSEPQVKEQFHTDIKIIIHKYQILDEWLEYALVWNAYVQMRPENSDKEYWMLHLWEYFGETINVVFKDTVHPFMPTHFGLIRY
jgi:hypothetical protein